MGDPVARTSFSPDIITLMNFKMNFVFSMYKRVMVSGELDLYK